MSREERAAKDREYRVTMVGNHMVKARENGFFETMTNERKRWTVVELIRWGLTSQQIHSSTGMSLAFVHDVTRDFAANCTTELARQLKENQCTQ
jgi:hypothetical protein